MFCSQIFSLKLNLRPQKWSDLCIFYIKLFLLLLLLLLLLFCLKPKVRAHHENMPI